MDVREKLVELVHNARMNALWHNAQKPDEYITDILMEDGVTVQEWISVKDRLPERNTEVLVCDTREDYVSVWGHMGDGLWYGNDIIWATEDITHWMPLPEPPKGE